VVVVFVWVGMIFDLVKRKIVFVVERDVVVVLLELRKERSMTVVE
jgi:hypothetical protein